MRGTVFPLLSSTKSKRITPARAGNRPADTLIYRAFSDHPRACGEQIPRYSCSYADGGSPPRVRGTVPSPAPQNFATRITPARAGNRTGCNRLYRPMGDHPRACGEQLPTLLTQFPAVGSPPRVRGTDSEWSENAAIVGITPARAGNRFNASRDAAGRRDHPRACGEQRRRPWSWGCLRGSPPRVRGTEYGGSRTGRHWGITPARAGNRIPPLLTLPGNRGSPPRVRGTVILI